jgi:SAM-dependent methyltransferase
MFSPYVFNYSWYVTHGHLVPLGIGLALGGIALWLHWPRWIAVASAVLVIWAAAGLFITLVSFGINAPLALPTDKFLASGEGRVLDAGAGSGRAAVGVLLARPKAHVTALDIYDGYWGIDDNTPARFMENARIAGAADRADAVRGDMRKLPFQEAEFDAAMSVAAIDHLRRSDIAIALKEFARVLKPQGEVLIVVVNPDLITKIASPHAIAHHRRWDPNEWRAMLDTAGFTTEEDGSGAGYLFFYGRKKA